jgi:hypothetical protein
MKPTGRAKLREHAEAGAPAGRRVLHRQQGGAAPFAAKAEALTEAQDTEQEGRDPAGHGVGG